MNDLTAAEQLIKDEAITFAKENKTAIARQETDKVKYPPDDEPSSVFMAGSPGAGKTEVAKAIIDSFKEFGSEVLRIDVDEMRKHFAAYNGSNSHLVQAGANILIERIHDMALKNKQHFILDGTFSHYNKAKQNIERSLKRDRNVLIMYVYLNPYTAWEFVKAREAVEGRRILPELFVEQYFNAREVVNQIKEEFGDQIRVDLLKKDLDSPSKQFYNVDKIDHHLDELYDYDELVSITQS